MKKIGYLGPRGTFTEAAARKYAGSEPAELVCCPGLPEIVAAVEGGQLDLGVVPLENSTEGAVGQILDLVARARDVRFCGEVVLKIDHCLMARPGIQKSGVRLVLSHPQALAQCRDYLARELPGVRTGETASTAQAAGMVAGSREPWAAIGTELAARSYGLEVLDRGIQDCGENATRFIVLGRTDAGYSPCSRTSLVVAAKDRPGALYGILREFAIREINLSRIESRPAKKRLGQYLFFIDLEGHRGDPGVKSAIGAISGKADYLKVLGSYPRDASMDCWEDRDVKEKKPAGLEEVRSEIDLVDSQIVDLIAVRTRLVEKIGALKANEQGVRDPAREDEVLGRVREVAARKGADPDTVESIYRLMISRSVELQRKALISLRTPEMDC
ncbi:MAG: prephenate dehydratase [Peptococcaceae bacterium]|nr:prephenate dehydratase [Peptococcaceae bacterium]